MASNHLKFKGEVFRGGFGSVPKMPLKDNSLPMESKALYAYLCSYAGDGVTAFPSVSLMSFDFGVTEKLISKYLKILITKGYISVEKSRSDGKFLRNVYTIESDLKPPTEKEKEPTPQKQSTVFPAVVLPPVAVPPVVLPPVVLPPVAGGGVISNSLINNSSINNSNINNKENKDNVEQAQLLPFSEIIEFLNSKTGKKFKASAKATQRLIKARFNDGYTLDDFKHVITVKTEQWLDDKKMDKFLKPETLFGTKFEGYLNEKLKGAKHNAPAITKDFTNYEEPTFF